MARFLLPAILYLLPFRLVASSTDTIHVFSEVMKRPVSSVVILPAGEKPAGGFPVLYLLHGFGGNHALWVSKVPALQALADRYGCVIVCPDGGRATLYFDNPLDSNYKFETHFIKELMPYIESHYAVSMDRRFRAISGLSMGGFGSFFIASRHPELFDAAGSMSGALNVESFAKFSSLRKAGIDSNCCLIQWKQLGGSLPVRLAMECGLDDYLLPANRNAHKKLMELGIPHDYTERPGRHEWPYWQNAIEFQLLFFRRYWDEAGD